MNLLDYTRITRALESAGLPADKVLTALDVAGIKLSVTYEQPRTHIVGTEHEV